MKNIKKFIPIIAAVLVVILAVSIVPKVVHKCDACGEVFFGAAYDPGALNSLMNDSQEKICKDCAAEQHAVALAMGKTLDDFKKPIF